MNSENRILIQENKVKEALLKGHFFKWLLASRRLKKMKGEVVGKTKLSLTDKIRQWRTRKQICNNEGNINIFILNGTTSKVVQVNTSLLLSDVAHLHNLPILDTWWSLHGRPLRMTMTLKDMNVHENDTITINGRLIGGSSDPTRLYTVVAECEALLLREDYNKFKLQAQITDNASDDMHTRITDVMEKLRSVFTHDQQWILETLESFVQVIYWFRKCDTVADYIMHVSMSYKLLTGQTFSQELWSSFDLCNLQADEDAYSKLLQNARDLFSSSSAIIKHPILKKIRKIFTYLLVQGCLGKLGMNMPPEEFLKLDAKTKIKNSDHVSMFMDIVDTVLSILERLDAYRLTGDWHALVHEDSSYAKWMADSDRLIALAPFTSNLVPHGTTYFTFLSELDAAIETGTVMCKYSKANTGSEGLSMRRKLNSLQMLKNVEVTRKSALQERKAPLGVLIHGHSSVAKSTFSKMLFYYYGKLHGLDTDDFYRYVRSPGQDHWDNFRTSMWAIQLDDIAFVLPSATSDPDPTLMEALHLIGNIAYVPPQADLADKGKTPVMSELVTATTNAKDLNATNYFHCPLAVQRRFSYVIHVEPKTQYVQENGMFINSAALPKDLDNFPDFWEITVQKCEPQDHNGRTTGRLVDVAKFSDISSFLAHFGEFSMKHKHIQEQALSCDKQMAKFDVCSLCYKPVKACKCVQAVSVGPWCLMMMSWLIAFAVNACGQMILHMLSYGLFMWCTQFYITRYAVAKFASICNAGVEVRLLGKLNSSYNMHFKITVKHIAKCFAILSSVYLTYKVVSKITRTEEQKETESDAPEMEIQGNIHGTTEEQLLKEESRNVWYNPTIELQRFDVPISSQSLAHLTAEGIRDLFAHNCVRLDIKSIDATMNMRLGGVFLRGQFLCMNRHALRRGTQFRIQITSGSSLNGISPNISFNASLDDFKFIEDRDIAVVRVPDVPPRKDILKYWGNAIVPVTQGVIVGRTVSGEVVYDHIYNIERKQDFPIESLDISVPMYLGTGSEMTKVGDCGSLFVAKTPRGPIILGIHTVGHLRNRGAPHVLREQLERLCKDPMPTVEGGGEPKLTLQGHNVLLPPHHKSLVRYLKEGVANIYGSVPGSRPKGRSRVQETPLQKEMLDYFNTKVEYGKPCMTGWEPIYNNVKDMIKPHTDIDRKCLRKCSQAYTNDILRELNSKYGDEWKKELVVLSDKAAVNGLPGVKFIDRLNTSTSMGSPWCEPKSRHLVPDVSDDYPEGVTFTPEVWKRIRDIEALYKEGKRAHTVFMSHNKDEAKEFAKIVDKKTRMFIACPADWAVVVRKNLLSFVRLVQKNKFIFEAAPGTVAQSIEWTHIYEYLTQHGKDFIVAGDYSKYDKSMIAQFVLEAYLVIIDIHRAAGFSEEECRTLACIAFDTAFPIVNLSGDIIEFFGTNPSGHPLTVVINSIVNSLYVRYAYCKLHPEEMVEDFRTNVALMTYGDDNAMGVSPTIGEWFNHCAIQKEMAKIGVGYTMADKGAKSVPFISIDKCSFLKRTWRWEEDLGSYVCPLEEKSIHKSLTVWLPSRTIDEYAQMVAVISSANSEYFFHGREVFERNRAFFKNLLEREPYKLYVTDSTLPDWDDLCDRFRRASANL